MKATSDQMPLVYELTRHWDTARRRKEVQEWLKRREWAVDSQPLLEEVRVSQSEEPSKK